jgi:hypothetical protein
MRAPGRGDTRWACRTHGTAAAGILDRDESENTEQLLEAVCCAIERAWNSERICAHAVAH